VGSSTVVKVYSVATGEVVRILDCSRLNRKATDSIVTSVQLNPTNQFQLYTASLDGTCRLWDYSDAVLLKHWSTNVPIRNMKVHPTLRDVVFILSPRKSDDPIDSGMSRILAIGLRRLAVAAQKRCN
jgi:NET1-associated nuclear protein 1 (U3 small nucleolar RNA-associated protein 17)